MEQAPNATKRPHSAEYFTESRDYWWNTDYLRLMAERLDFASVATVLDVGCGVGHWGRALAQVLPEDARLTGVDREEEWVRKAGERAERAGLGARFRYQQGDALGLPFPDSSFDLVTCQTVLMHLPDPLGGLREMLRVARRGGLVLAVEPNNLASSTIFDSRMDTLPTEVIVDAIRFHLICQRGKRALGLGFNNLGDLLPGMLASLGVDDLRVYQADKLIPFIPPYDRPDTHALVEQLRDWARREFWAWDKTDTRRYFIAGGGAEAEFERYWAMAGRENHEVVAAIDAGTYHCGGGSVRYMVSGRKR